MKTVKGAYAQPAVDCVTPEARRPQLRAGDIGVLSGRDRADPPLARRHLVDSTALSALRSVVVVLTAHSAVNPARRSGAPFVAALLTSRWRRPGTLRPMSVEDLAQQAAESVRKVVAEAQEEAAKIIAAAEQEAEGIRARAEAEARDQVEGARKALEDLTARFGSSSSANSGTKSSPVPDPAPSPPSTPAPEPIADTPEQRDEPAAPPSEPAPAAEPEPVAVAPSSPPAAGDDSQAARLVAMKMALDGASRDEIDSELASSYELSDRGALLDDVLAKAGK
jgi:hypothetical protein